jgi:hypothetical protein
LAGRWLTGCLLANLFFLSTSVDGFQGEEARYVDPKFNGWQMTLEALSVKFLSGLCHSWAGL